MTNQGPYHRVKDVAVRFNTSTDHVTKLIALGVLPAVRISRNCVRIADADVQRFLATNRVKTQAVSE